MEQNQRDIRRDYLAQDYQYLFRCLKRNLFVIVMCACITLIGVYVALDYFMKDSYQASIQLAVVPRDAAGSKQSDGSVNTAVSRSMSVLNSSMLKEQIRKNSETEALNGTLRAAQVGQTNLITMSATADTAEHAFRLLKAGLENYPQLSGYFETGYLLQRLSGLSADSIVTLPARTEYYAFMAGMLVLAAGVGLTVMAAVMTDKIHSAEQGEKLLETGILGKLVYVKKGKNQNALLITDPRTDAFYIEDVDKMVTNVQEKMDAHHYKTLMVTSVQENEGKSTGAANIALNLAQRGNRVVLVDCDLRRPALRKMFELYVDKGIELTGLLEGKSELADALQPVGQTDNLSAVVQFKVVPEPDKLLEKQELGELLEQIKAQADYVILDTPPMGIVRDAEVTAKSADAAILFIKQDEVKAAVVNDLVDLLENAGTSAIGCVLNMTRGNLILGGGSYGKYGKYGGYRYGYKAQR